MTPGAACAGHEDAAPRAVSLFDLEARFFVPTHGSPLASCRDAVKAGRRAGRGAGTAVSRPRLDGGAHEARLSRVGAPAGLDLGAITPDEIAVSILAEIIALRRGARARVASG